MKISLTGDAGGSVLTAARAGIGRAATNASSAAHTSAAASTRSVRDRTTGAPQPGADDVMGRLMPASGLVVAWALHGENGVLRRNMRRTG